MVSSSNEKIYKLKIHETFEEIHNEVKEKGKFSNDKLTASAIENKDLKASLTDSNYLFIKTNESHHSFYNGTVNERLEREGIGMNKFPNGDYYLGEWNNNLRHNSGIYLFKVSKLGTRNIFECYVGSSNGNNKHGLGAYIWVNDDINNNTIEYEKLYLDAYVGLFHTNCYNFGLFLSKEALNYYTYYGKFDQHGKKHDDKALLYDNKSDFVLRARFEKDEIKEAYQVKFDNDENESLISFKYLKYENGVPKTLVEEDYIDKASKDRIVEECRLYRDILVETDCFNKIYLLAKKVENEVPKYQSLEVLNSTEGTNNANELIYDKTVGEIFSSLHKQLA